MPVRVPLHGAVRSRRFLWYKVAVFFAPEKADLKLLPTVRATIREELRWSPRNHKGVCTEGDGICNDPPCNASIPRRRQDKRPKDVQSEQNYEEGVVCGGSTQDLEPSEADHGEPLPVEVSPAVGTLRSFSTDGLPAARTRGLS